MMKMRLWWYAPSVGSRQRSMSSSVGFCGRCIPSLMSRRVRPAECSHSARPSRDKQIGSPSFSNIVSWANPSRQVIELRRRIAGMGGCESGITLTLSAYVAAVTFTLETLLGRLDHASITGAIVRGRGRPSGRAEPRRLRRGRRRAPRRAGRTVPFDRYRDWRDRGRGVRGVHRVPASSTARIFSISTVGVNGLCRRPTAGSSTLRITASSV
jgi:hypothetical protein